ncbi:diguanylate cyclase (GGDEF) domain-containing protein [Pelagirhabdus alkalitolerans]|uniref:Diguanylate cyclase (GGDEF) domain-containing protein n=1 Tax=Pelagirhabdus alkalitolerans TaxID=1612202 RepID=A0A1G6H9N4_9BACI|nr:diguanylate cyclase [Pelagirhabdus alkalitolerans]SDB90655.1 diguanylate cyclase (GGDEF) domain-containing protein [Pelagirhabdus alkalitolerans]
MNEQLLSFLIEADHQLSFIKTYWQSPVYLLSPIQTKASHFFHHESYLAVENALNEAIKHPNEVIEAHSIRLIAPDTWISLYVLVRGEQVLLYGTESKNETVAVAVMLQPFFNLILGESEQLNTNTEHIMRAQFEQIQRLNNDLTNTQRQLAKANQHLTQVNNKLNNRLVTDELTGLIGRYQYESEMTRVINQDPHAKGIFVFIDLDGFKQINDQYGHQMGDQYLIEFSKRLKTLDRSDTIVMRISGDEFGVYRHGYSSVTNAEMESVWSYLDQHLFNEPIKIGSHEFQIHFSAGLAVYNQDANHVYQLIDFADFAMYQAKRKGKHTFECFDAILYQKSSRNRGSL